MSRFRPSEGSQREFMDRGYGRENYGNGSKFLFQEEAENQNREFQQRMIEIDNASAERQSKELNRLINILSHPYKDYNKL